MRRRAATVSMCRYTVPQSPICRPSAAPQNSPPSLILPPPGSDQVSLVRSISKLSIIDERLASSAPSGSSLLSAVFQDAIGTTSVGTVSFPVEFSLLEEESPAQRPAIRLRDQVDLSQDLHFLGFDDQDDASPALSARTPDETPITSFGGSPILISCLRDIAKIQKRSQLAAKRHVSPCL